MSKKDTPTPDPNYWRSLADLYDPSGLAEDKANEFARGVTDGIDLSKMSMLSRRKFLALLGASAAVAGVGCSEYDGKGEIIAYNKKPEEVLPGRANYYASTCNGCDNACGILIKTREGRPIKIDGNPDHPVNQGKLCVRGQADILNLYEPGRYQKPQKRTKSDEFHDVSWNESDKAIIAQLNETVSQGREIAVITGSLVSPSGKKVLADFQKKYPTAKVYGYQILAEAPRRQAWELCYGTRDLPAVQWDKARVVLALESDFLGTEGNRIEQVRGFARGRDIMENDSFNRLYAVEGNMSVTGMNADYRLRLRPDAQAGFVMALLNELIVKRGLSAYAGNSGVLSNLKQHTLSKFAENNGLDTATLGFLVDDLVKHRDQAIVVAGMTLPVQVQIAVLLLNEVLGSSALYRNDAYTSAPVLSSKDDWENLIASMNAGNVGVVIHYDSNPVYLLPDDYQYEAALSAIPLIVSMNEGESESAMKGHYILPIHHNLESWGDAKVRTGVYSLRQPVVSPLFESRQKESILLSWIGGTHEESTYHDYLKTFWETEIYPTLDVAVDFKTFWYAALHDGVVLAAEAAPARSAFDVGAFVSMTPLPESNGGYALLLTDNHTVGGDGRFANVGWLHEMPHPVSKITWDNYAAVSKNTAEELGLNYRNNQKANKSDVDIVELNVDGRTEKFPVFVQPGIADKTIVVELGFGRRNGGVVGTGVGVDAGTLMSKNWTLSPWFYTNVIAQKVNGTYELVSTQEHHLIDDEHRPDGKKLSAIAHKREIIQEGTLSEYKSRPDFLRKKYHHPEVFDITDPVQSYHGLKWAMAIDLNKCIGCGDCIISCNVENNLPVVGKDQVKVGRELHWIRIDRYYSGTVDNPTPSVQPMLCQHCDNAPCEPVCPVAATVHTPEGINTMAYNRCVGTRYCSNNCPYKVRRFNYFNFRDHFADGYYEDSPVLELLHNPEVTVRSRGVMEKCSFCIQRTMEGRQEAIKENREIKDGDVVTACQEACNSDAIVFGNLNDVDSKVHKYAKHYLHYNVLKETNTRPNIYYIAKLRNTHSEDKA